MNAKLVSNAVRCLSTVVFLVTCITSARTEAASYLKTNGTIVDPIRTWLFPSIHLYTGRNLEPGAKNKSVRASWPAAWPARRHVLILFFGRAPNFSTY